MRGNSIVVCERKGNGKETVRDKKKPPVLWPRLLPTDVSLLPGGGGGEKL